MPRAKISLIRLWFYRCYLPRRSKQVKKHNPADTRTILPIIPKSNPTLYLSITNYNLIAYAVLPYNRFPKKEIKSSSQSVHSSHNSPLCIELGVAWRLWLTESQSNHIYVTFVCLCYQLWNLLETTNSHSSLSIKSVSSQSCDLLS